MPIPASLHPGRHERQFLRRRGNALFARPAGRDDDAGLLESQRLDHEELLDFLGRLRETVQRAVSLKPQSDSDTVMQLKADLERLYELSCSLPDEQDGNKAAIRQLLAVIVETMRRHTGNDPLAQQELEMAEQARLAHFQLLETRLVAELLHPQSSIGADELVPTLLSSDAAELKVALKLFDPEQLRQLCHDGRRLLAELDPQQQRLPPAWERLELIQQRLSQVAPAQ